MARPPNLPSLPSGFADHSPFPPMHRPPPPPPPAPALPPLPPGALEREQNLRARQAHPYQHQQHQYPHPPPPPPPPPPQQRPPYPHQAYPYPHQPANAPPRIVMSPPPAAPIASFTPGQIIPHASPRQSFSGASYVSPSQPQHQQQQQQQYQHQRFSSTPQARPPPPTIVRSPSPSFPGAFDVVPQHRHGLRPHSFSEAAPPHAIHASLSAPNVGGLDAAVAGARHSFHSTDAAAASALTAGVANMGLAASHSAALDVAPRRASVAVDADVGLMGGAVGAHQPAQGVLAFPLPDLEMLASMRASTQHADVARRLAWAKHVIRYVERKVVDGKVTDPELKRFVHEAIHLVRQAASANPPNPMALYLRGDLLASGAFPSYLAKDLKSAFADFELAARLGHHAGWFRVGRDFEVLDDAPRALETYGRGLSAGDVGCTYRMGMAHLLGQLGLNVDHARAIRLLRDAADKSNLDTPQPAYIYGMLLAGEFSHVEVPKHLLKPVPDPSAPHAPVTLESEARRRIERSAYLHFAPAQFKCGWMYEYAKWECAFDPLLSVQYYSLASQGGETEADVALSKWFLCGAEGCFERNESLAYTFADKAARRGLPTAEFALAYYHEVGVGCEVDLEAARRMYKLAASHGNADARERLQALEGPTPSALSRQEHEAHVDVNLQRKRTEAKVKSERRRRNDAAGGGGGGGAAGSTAAAAGGGGGGGAKGSSSGGDAAFGAARPAAPMAQNELTRKQTMRMVHEVAAAATARPAGRGGNRRGASEAMPTTGAAGGGGGGGGGGHHKAATSAAGSAEHGGGGRARYNGQPPLSESYASLPTPPQQPHQQQPQGGRMGAAGAGTPRPSAGGAKSSQSPSRPVGGAGGSSGGGAAAAAAAAASSSSSSSSSNGGGNSAATASTEPIRVYQTFSEMGFAPKTAKDDRDCVVM